MNKKVNVNLAKYTLNTLNQVGLLCGITSGLKKNDRINAISHHLDFITSIRRTVPIRDLNILSIDIGIKNFSYCNTIGNNLIDNTKLTINGNWSKINLHDKYGKLYEPLSENMSSLIESKRYLSHLSYSIIKDLILNSSDKPDIIVIETQRTRSNNNSITLPNVLLNYTFENMLYANFYTLSQCNKKDFNTKSIIVPVISNSMANFWLNRFVSKESISKNSKKLRNRLFFNWLMDPVNSPIKVGNLHIDDNFRKLSPKQQAAKLLVHLNLDEKDKVDDLIDSLLYNVMIKEQLQNSIRLQDFVLRDDDLNEFVTSCNKLHLNYIHNVIQENKLEVNLEFDAYIK